MISHTTEYRIVISRSYCSLLPLYIGSQRARVCSIFNPTTSLNNRSSKGIETSIKTRRQGLPEKQKMADLPEHRVTPDQPLSELTLLVLFL